MQVHHPNLFVAGACVLGYLFPEFLLLFSKRPINIPQAQNVLCAVAFGLMAYAVVH